MRKIVILLFLPLWVYGQESTIGDLTAVSTVNDADAYVVEQSDSTRKITWAMITDSMEMPLSGLQNPLDNLSLNLANKTVTYTFTNPAGGMYYNWTGAASGHLFELNQNTGNPGAGTHLLHIESNDTDVAALHLAPAGDTAITTTKNIYAGSYYGTWAGNGAITPSDTAAMLSLYANHIANTSNPHSVDKTDVGLSNVENTALSTWTGSSNITTLGTIGQHLSIANTFDLKILGENGRGIIFGDGSSWLKQNTDNEVYIGTNDSVKFAIYPTVISFYKKLVPSGNKQQDFGGAATFIRYGYLDRVYIDNVNTYIDVSGSEISFTDATNGTQALGDLIGLSPGDTSAMLSPYLSEAEAAAAYQPLESTLTDIADGTINENLVNTANPWADNEVADNITITNISQVQDITATATEINYTTNVDRDIQASMDSIAGAYSSGSGTIEDTVVIPYTIPWAFTDSAGMLASRDYAPFVWTGTTDTIGIDSVCVMSITSGTPNFTFQMYVNDTLNTTATTAVTIFSSAQTVGATSTTIGQWFTPNNRTYILPDEKIWIRFIGRATVPEYGATLQINGTVY